MEERADEIGQPPAGDLSGYRLIKLGDAGIRVDYEWTREALESMQKDWFKGCYRRNLLDMHISDWDPRFLAKAEPKSIADTFSLDNSRAIHVFANSHTGLCYYPTAVGTMHRGLKGRDLLGELIELYHRRGIYMSSCTIRWSTTSGSGNNARRAALSMPMAGAKSC